MDQTRRTLRRILEAEDIRIEGPQDGSDLVTHDIDPLLWIAYGPEGVETSWTGNQVGWILVARNAPQEGFYVGQVSVAPEYQRRGVSSRLHDAVFEYLSQRGEPLHSGWMSGSPENQAYWAKLEHEGKAEKVSDGDDPRYVRTA
jgi:GNAT superfamily N-acetyltransferase